MNRKLCAIYVIGSVFLGSTLALGNLRPARKNHSIKLRDFMMLMP
ncbi:MAG: hypothetical protein WBO24_16760 [Nitrospirales bacterium]